MIFEPKNRPEVKEIKFGDLVITDDDQYIVSRLLLPDEECKLLISLSANSAYKVDEEVNIIEFLKREFCESVESVISTGNLRLMEV